MMKSGGLVGYNINVANYGLAVRGCETYNAERCRKAGIIYTACGRVCGGKNTPYGSLCKIK